MTIDEGDLQVKVATKAMRWASAGTAALVKAYAATFMLNM
jgi:hypothetical protein